MLKNDLVIGQVVKNSDLSTIFKVGNMGGMRRSHETNSLVLVSDHTKGIYDDRWVDNICYYTGMGLKGNQELASQNKTLYESNENGINVYLLEVHVASQYRYHGQVKLAGNPFQEDQFDVENNLRKVWVFPIKPIDIAVPVSIPKQEVVVLETKREKSVRKLSNASLKKHLDKAPKEASAVQTTTKTYYRNPYVVEYVRRRSNGICELCDSTGPFIIGDGLPFLEVHHVKWLAEGGDDTVENTVALCPNCHRKMHFKNLSDDVQKLLVIAKSKLL
jgi:5-methylcytosine-specific restriction enzyme A